MENNPVEFIKTVFGQCVDNINIYCPITYKNSMISSCKWLYSYTQHTSILVHKSHTLVKIICVAIAAEIGEAEGGVTEPRQNVAEQYHLVRDA